MRARAIGIPRDALSALVDGGLQDLEQTRYATFDELRGYCEKVAGAVGVACIAVYGSDDVERAMTLGIALQLINIMRDVDEDLELGRVYLPQDELERFGVARARPRHAGVGAVHGVPGAARARASRRGAAPARLARPAERALRVDVRRPLPRAARPHGGERLRRVRPRRAGSRRARSSRVVARGLLR